MTDWPGEPSSTREEMMLATYRALCEHGYPGTSIQRIADEFDKSKSLLYYHYDDKEALLADFLRFLLEELRAELEAVPDDEPRAAIERVLEGLLPAPIDDEGLRFRRAMSEMRSQAPYHVVYHEQFARFDEVIRAELARAIKRGVEDGTFREVEPTATAEHVFTFVVGALHRAVTLDDPDLVARDRELLDEYLESELYDEG